MIKRIIAGLLALFAFAAVLVGAPAASQTATANAGNCSWGTGDWGWCGRIHNLSGTSLTIIRDWGTVAPTRVIGNNVRSNPTWVDTDGFRINWGGCVVLWKFEASDGSHWNFGRKYAGTHKITDSSPYGNWYVRPC